jgi:hypothetical protein
VAILLTSLHEYRRGLRLALVSTAEARIVRELVTPALAQVEWHAHREKVILPDGKKLAAALASDAEPTPGLRKLASCRRARAPK